MFRINQRFICTINLLYTGLYIKEFPMLARTEAVEQYPTLTQFLLKIPYGNDELKFKFY